MLYNRPAVARLTKGLPNAITGASTSESRYNIPAPNTTSIPTSPHKPAVGGKYQWHTLMTPHARIKKRGCVGGKLWGPDLPRECVMGGEERSNNYTPSLPSSSLHLPNLSTIQWSNIFTGLWVKMVTDG